MIYHHTDSARLPWILRDQALKPGGNRVGGYPDDFLWATLDAQGEPSASCSKSMYCDGRTAAVRFTLADAEFTPWDDMKVSHPSWRPHHIERLERDAARLGVSSRQIAQWRCRIEPLPGHHWLAVEFRTWRNPRWRPAPTEILRADDNVL